MLESSMNLFFAWNLGLHCITLCLVPTTHHLSDVVPELRGDWVAAPLLEDAVVVDGGDARHRRQVRDRRLQGRAAQRRKRLGRLERKISYYY